MGAAAVPLMVASTVMSVAGGIQQGQAADAQGKAQQKMYNQIALQQEAQGRQEVERAGYIAAQNESMAGQERAASQRQAMEQQRQKRLVQSRGQAVAAASGGGALDPGVLDIMGSIEDQGNYNALVALYEGESAARNYESQAALTRWEGQNALNASKTEAWGSRQQGALARAEGKAKKRQAYIGAAASALGGVSSLSGATSLFTKYGQGASFGLKTGGQAIGKGGFTNMVRATQGYYGPGF